MKQACIAFNLPSEVLSSPVKIASLSRDTSIRNIADGDTLPHGKGLTFFGEDSQPSTATIATSCQKNQYCASLRRKSPGDKNKEQLKSIPSKIYYSLDKRIKTMPNHFLNPAEPYSPERKVREETKETNLQLFMS